MKLQQFIKKLSGTKLSKLLLISIASLTLIVCSDGGCDGNDSFSFRGALTGNNTSPAGAIIKGASVATSSNYVYAVQTNRLGMDYPWRNKTAINADGSFSISLGKGYSWALAFIDSSKSGQDMIQGIFKASSLDSVSPLSSGSSSGTDVGELSVDVAAVADIDPTKYTTYVGDLGMTLADAEQYGALDDLSLRYINPDIDNNGVMDMDDPSMPSFRLELSNSYRFGTTSYMSSVQNGMALPADTNIALHNYSGTGPSGFGLRIKKTSSGFFSSLPGKLELEWTDSGNYTGPNPAVWEGATPTIFGCTEWGNWVEGLQEIGCSHSFDITVTDIPDGTYTFRFYTNSTDTTPAQTWAFPHVQTMADTSATDGFIFPFPVFNVDANDDVISIDYQWMKKEGVAFVPATSRDIELLIGTDFANIGWSDGSCGDDTCGNTLEWRPYDTGYATSGTFSYADVRSGVNAKRKRSEIKEFGMSFTSKLGTTIRLTVL